MRDRERDRKKDRKKTGATEAAVAGSGVRRPGAEPAGRRFRQKRRTVRAVRERERRDTDFRESAAAEEA